MANETMSPKQAKEVLNQYQEIINDSVNKIGKEYNDFFVILQNEWEDVFAKNLSNDLISEMKEYIDKISKISKNFVDKVILIEKDNMPEPMEITFQLPKLNIKSNVKEKFDDEMVGFKTAESPKKVSDALTVLQNNLGTITTETTNKLKSLNAYGNDFMIQSLAISTGKVIEILQEIIIDLNDKTKKYVNEAAKEYIK